MASNNKSARQYNNTPRLYVPLQELKFLSQPFYRDPRVCREREGNAKAVPNFFIVVLILAINAAACFWQQRCNFPSSESLLADSIKAGNSVIFLGTK